MNEHAHRVVPGGDVGDRAGQRLAAGQHRARSPPGTSARRRRCGPPTASRGPPGLADLPHQQQGEQLAVLGEGVEVAATRARRSYPRREFYLPERDAKAPGLPLPAPRTPMPCSRPGPAGHHPPSSISPRWPRRAQTAPALTSPAYAPQGAFRIAKPDSPRSSPRRRREIRASNGCSAPPRPSG